MLKAWTGENSTTGSCCGFRKRLQGPKTGLVKTEERERQAIMTFFKNSWTTRSLKMAGRSAGDGEGH